ncbi:HupE / UreJ protein [Reichenbachiella faecimaris]|uniref:HupE / UreJ protein n=1 Tax=Reichenbachiella faecimaris TaxID=692418 RepID=A0A1W2GHS3_REIFA|nr:HupE/UreJ family protein [Reichenbachiella faecimaris]SMD36205.1 HupE / UreJ protein [Reichenbachiella faecimaris]
MSEFQLFFSLGREHILDVNGYDHILFVIALAAVYLSTDWMKVLILVTAFTIGHSITLALISLNVFSINSSVVEFLIPVTIFITAVCNIWKREQYISSEVSRLNYYLALFFGLIHGMGYLMNKYIHVSRKDWILAISSAVAGVAITLMIDTIFW